MLQGWRQTPMSCVAVMSASQKAAARGRAETAVEVARFSARARPPVAALCATGRNTRVKADSPRGESPLKLGHGLCYG
jgi:hypothetical protein